MADEYRLSIGIDASDATQGAETAKAALDQIAQKAESTVVKVDKLEVSLTKVVDAAGKVTVFKDVQRSLDDTSAATERLASSTEVLKQKNEEFTSSTDKVKAALQDTASATDVVKEAVADNVSALKALKNESRSAVTSLKEAAGGVSAVAKAADSAGTSVKGMTVTLADLLQSQEQSGDYGAKQFLDMAAGADVATDSVQGLKAAAEDTGDTLDGMVPEFNDWNDYARGMEVVVDANQQVAKSSAEAEAILDSFGPAMHSAGEDAGFLTAEMAQLMAMSEENAKYWEAAKEDLSAGFQNARDAIVEAEGATSGYSHTLSILAEDMAHAGDQVEAMRLMEMSDQFKTLERHIRDALAPGSELLQEFEQSLGMVRGEVYNVYEAYGQLLKDQTATALAFQQGAIDAEQYSTQLAEIDGRIASLLPKLREMRSQLQADESAKKATEEVTEMSEQLLETRRNMPGQNASTMEAAAAGSTVTAALHQAGRMAAGMAGVGFGAAAFAQAKSMASDYEKQLVQLQSAMELTEGQTQEMTTAFRALGDEFGNSTIEEAAASLGIASKGFRETAENTEVLAAANHLARASFTDLQTASQILPQIMSAFAMEAGEAQSAAETLAVASHGNAQAMYMMSMMAGRVGPQLQQAGISLDDFAAASATLSESIGGGSRGTMKAMAGLVQLVERLTNVTPELQQKMEKYGLSIDASSVKSRGLTTVLKEIIDKTHGNKAALTELLGSTTAATNAMTLFKDGGAALEEQMDRITDKSRIMSDMEKRVAESWEDQANALKKGLLSNMIELGKYIKAGLLPVLQFLVRHLDEFFTFLTAAGAWVTFKSAVMTVTTLMKALGITFTETALKAEGAFGAMARSATVASATIKSAFNGIGAAILVGFTTYSIAAIMREQLMKSIPAFDEYTSLVLSYFIEMFQQIGLWVAKAVTGFVNAWTGGIGVLQDLMGRVVVSFGEMLKGSKAFGFMSDDVIEFGENLRTSGEGRINQFTQRMQDATSSIEEAIQKNRVYRDELRSAVEYQNSAAAAVERAAVATAGLGGTTEAATEATVDLIDASENQIQQMREIAKGDSRKAINEQIDALNRLIETAQTATNLPPGLKDEFISAATKKIAELNRNLVETAVAAHNLALADNPLTTFWNNLAKGIDPARDALVAMEEQLKRLAYLLEHKKISETAAAQAARMAAEAYLQAAQAGTAYEQRVRALVDSIRPVEAIQRDLNKQLAEAARMLGIGSQAYAEYARQTKAAAEQQIRMTELQSDALLQLTAKYDPLIANELERQKALIEMEFLLDKANLSEQDRVRWAAKAGQVINEQYDRQARQLRGHITLADAWKKAWESAIERIDGAFADLWKSMFDGMDSFKEALKDTAKQIVAEIAHAKITRPLIMKMGEALTKVPKVGEIFGDLGKEVMGRLEGGYASTANKTDWQKVIAAGTEEGVSAAMSACMGTEDGGLGSALGKGIESLADDVIGSFDGFKDDMSAALDDFSGVVMGRVREQIMGSSAGGVGVVTGSGGAAGGGWLSQVGNALMAGKFGKTLAGLSTTLSAFGTAFQGGLSTWMAGGGYSSLSQVALGAQSGVAGWGSMAGQAVGGAGIGMAGGWATDQLLGSRGNAGRNMAFSAVGGIIGSFWGPLGSLAGGAIGSFVDNAIGGGEEIKDFGYEIAVEGGKVMGDFYTKVKKYGSWFSSSTKVEREELDWFNPVLRQMQAAFKQTRDMLLTFQKELGGSVEAIKDFSDYAIKISTKGKKPEQVEAEVAQAQLDLSGRQIQAYLGAAPAAPVQAGDAASIWKRVAQILSQQGADARVDETTNTIMPAQFKELLNTFLISGKDLIELNPDLKKAGDAFKNSMHYTAEFIEAFKQLATLTMAINMKPSVEGFEMYKLANATLTEQYKELAKAAVEVAGLFDGTIESITQVTDAFVAQRTAAVQLAAALHQAKEEITKMFSDTAESIRESLMEPEELYDYRKSRAEELAQQMRTTTDPGELSRLANEINTIVNSLYSSLDETQREAMAPGFLSFLDEVEVVLAQSVQQGLSELDTSATTVNEQVLAAMSSAANVQSAATSTFNSSVNQFGASVQAFANAVNSIVTAGNTASIAPVTPASTSNVSPNNVFRYIRVNYREVNA